MLLKSLIYIPIVLLSAATATILLVGGRSTRDKLYFVCSSYLFALWAFFAYIADLNTAPSQRLFYLRISLLMGTLMTSSFPFFAAAYLKRQLHTLLVAAISIITFILLLFNFSDLMVSEVTSMIGVLPTKIGPIYQLQSVYTVVALFASMIWMFVGTRKKPVDRAKVRLILYGLGAATIINFVTSFLFAAYGKSEMVGIVGPPSLLLFFVPTYISISRYRIFDVRRYVFRFVLYLSALGGFVALLSFGFRLLEDTWLDWLRFVFIAFAIVSFDPMRRSFERLTNMLFFRGEYEVGREVNNILRLMLGETESAQVEKKVLTYVRHKLAVGELLLLDKSDAKARADGQAKELVYSLGVDSSKALFVGDKLNGSALSSKDKELLEATAKNLGVMLKNIEYTERIKQFNETLQTKIEDATESLRESNQALEQLSTAKDEFISMASHQIRPQLTAVRGFIDILQQSRVSKDQRDLLEFSGTGIERSLRIIADMLNLSRFSSGKLVIDKRPIDLVELVENEVRQLQPLIMTSGVKMRVAIDLKDADVEADEIKIREVIANMLHNAIQYSPAKTEAVASVVKKGAMYRFTVRDFGMGVPKEEAGHLFEKFYRTSSAKDKRPAGTGIGLFLAKTVVEAHGGRVFYEPADPGSVFGFELPAAK